MTDTPETDAACNAIYSQGMAHIPLVNFMEKLERERDMYQRQADYLVERLGETQMRMIDAERICNKIYVARNISLSEKCVVSALAEIDKTYRTKHNGN